MLLDVALADGACVGELAVTGDHQHVACRVLPPRLFLEMRRQAVEALAGQADAGRGGGGQRCDGRGGGSERQTQTGKQREKRA